MIQNFGGGELVVIVILALVVLGPERIPEMARGAGKMIARLKSMTSGIQGQVQGVMDDPAMQPLKELGDFAVRPRQKLAEYALEAEAEERAKAEKASLDAAAEGDAVESTTPAASAPEPPTNDIEPDDQPAGPTGTGTVEAGERESA